MYTNQQRIEKPDLRSAYAVLRNVAQRTNLAEGSEGVRRIVRAIAQGGSTPLHELCRVVSMPVPVVAAVRRELEKLGLVCRKGGITLSSSGYHLAHDGLNLSKIKLPQPPTPYPIPNALKVLLPQMQTIWETRPSVDPSLDQSHSTTETALKRASYLFQQGSLEGLNIMILGDDDLTSLAINLIAKEMEFELASLVVLEKDERLADFIVQKNKEMGTSVSVVNVDLRNPLPTRLASCSDIFFTDPPYTIEGFELFVSRGVESLKTQVGKRGFICFGTKTPVETNLSIGTLVKMGLAPVEIIPNFNRYIGAQMLAGTSHMIQAVSTGNLGPSINGKYEGRLYTRDAKIQ